MARLPLPDETSSPSLAEVFAEIAGTRGYVSNALRSLGHAPEGLRHFARVGAYCKYSTDLPERLRELAILCAACGVDYAWTHHSRLAVQAGIPQTAIDDIGAGRVPTALPPPEQALVRYVHELFTPQSVSRATFDELARYFTPRQIIDISFSATYYRALGAIVVALEVETEPAQVLQIEQAWQRNVAKL